MHRKITSHKQYKFAHAVTTLCVLGVTMLPAFADAEPRAQKELPGAESIKDMIIRMDDPKTPVPTAQDNSAPTPGVLTLKGAVSEAVNGNQSINHDRFEAARFKYDYYAAQAGRLPNVRAISYLSQSIASQNAGIPSQANAFVFLSALMPVTHQYRLGLQAKVIKLADEIAHYKLIQQIDDTTAKVKTIYYKVVLDQTKVQSLEVSVKYLKELYITTSNRYKEGSALRVDGLKVEASLEKANLELSRARHEMREDTEKLNHLVGTSIANRPVLESIPPPEDTEIDEKKAEAAALANRPEIRAADARRRQINTEKKIFLAQYIPNVSVGAIYLSLPGFNNTVVPKNLIAPGIFMTYDAFDWGRRGFMAKAQSKSEQAALLNVANAKDEVLIDLHTQIDKLADARLAVKTSKFARDVALEDLRVSMNRYKFTSDKLAEVLAATTAVAAANDLYQQGLLAFWEAKAQFDRAVGE